MFALCKPICFLPQDYKADLGVSRSSIFIPLKKRCPHIVGWPALSATRSPRLPPSTSSSRRPGGLWTWSRCRSRGSPSPPRDPNRGTTFSHFRPGVERLLSQLHFQSIAGILPVRPVSRWLSHIRASMLALSGIHTSRFSPLAHPAAGGHDPHAALH